MRIEVDGLPVEIHENKLRDWRTIRLFAKLDTKVLTADVLDSLVWLVERISDATEEKIIEHCGGDDAQLEDVAKVFADILTAAYPKN